MALPVVALPSASVKIGDAEVEVRSLSRIEARAFFKRYAEDSDASEDFLLSCGVGVSEEEACAWRASTPSDVVDALITAILELSALTEGAQKSDS